jgi:hypothetical protein
MMRSQSHASAAHVPTLAPSRSERTKLENGISDIWTRSAIPFPGMGSKNRGESSIRASANSVMRKLSMASIASNFSKRSASHTTMSAFTMSAASVITGSREDSLANSQLKPKKERHYFRSRTPTSVPLSVQNARIPSSREHQKLAVVDFHTAPEAFLPEDFEIAPQRPGCRVPKLSERLSNAMNPTTCRGNSTERSFPLVTASILQHVRLPTLYSIDGNGSGSIRAVRASPPLAGDEILALTTTVLRKDAQFPIIPLLENDAAKMVKLDAEETQVEKLNNKQSSSLNREGTTKSKFSNDVTTAFGFGTIPKHPLKRLIKPSRRVFLKLVG